MFWIEFFSKFSSKNNNHIAPVLTRVTDTVLDLKETVSKRKVLLANCSAWRLQIRSPTSPSLPPCSKWTVWELRSCQILILLLKMEQDLDFTFEMDQICVKFIKSRNFEKRDRPKQISENFLQPFYLQLEGSPIHWQKFWKTADTDP